ncbi:MAG TPA: hypothetical protein VHB50_00005, partial [Bryobacteraceae bacterium]|nr:hypothetical protein [Bryobacteraceae bacterium]
MSNGAARQQLLGTLRADEPEFWSILHELAQTPESRRRAILRPHAEAGFVRERERVTIAQRARLDAALGALTRYEIGLELGILTPDDPVPADRADLRELFDNSEALLRYANAYLYFGVRFLGGRLFPPEWMTDPAPRNPPQRESNARPFALMTPPPTGDPAASGSAVPGFLEFLNPANPDMDAAFLFLDDFIADNEEPTRLERWLHGLLPETDGAMESRFSAIARGMTAWAINRSNFYLSLQAPSEPVPNR